MRFDNFRYPFALEVWTLLTLPPPPTGQFESLTPKWRYVHRGKLPPSQTKEKAPEVKRLGKKRRHMLNTSIGATERASSPPTQLSNSSGCISRLV
ncbi:hypothetical protein BO79DRAFT_240419 [Aspergillus costaricaensis CBS 115574]|uniref:Uncharacterized protein n=1 Tax=Aspergillus costaricaensis CBS 115574 TaxID=1448317 RepID=A0ACD1I468_9EURO|nr:hypothetical protein BO79DRAFT_240419 [Aspergillus costaricaensis CBS 115574]RAK84561.1 hypothetical protein BO79DRAFT_240419 [Aspergillus costaricaensis CBS 115574]